MVILEASHLVFGFFSRKQAKNIAGLAYYLRLSICLHNSCFRCDFKKTGAKRQRTQLIRAALN